MRFKLKTNTKEQREYIEFVEKTASAVRAWPSWMRGDYRELKQIARGKEGEK